MAKRNRRTRKNSRTRQRKRRTRRTRRRQRRRRTRKRRGAGWEKTVFGKRKSKSRRRKTLRRRGRGVLRPWRGGGAAAHPYSNNLCKTEHDDHRAGLPYRCIKCDHVPAGMWDARIPSQKGICIRGTCSNGTDNLDALNTPPPPESGCYP